LLSGCDQYGCLLTLSTALQEIPMGHVELIHKLESLPSAQRNAVMQLVDALLLAERRHDPEQLDAAIAAARGSWPRKMSLDEIDAEVRAMRDEWGERD
jgi:hypothetical protein